MPLLLEKTTPGATTCLLVGAAAGTEHIPFARYRAVLWFVDAQNSHLAPPIAADRLQVVRVDTGSTPQLAPTLESFVRRDLKRLPDVLVTAEAAHAGASVYREIIEEIYSQLASAQQARLTRQMDGFVWQKHILTNIGPYVRRRVPNTWEGRLRGCAALVCGAGPSLNVSLPILAPVTPHLVVLSADSALRALARHGVEADLAVSTDAAKHPDRCLPETRTPARVVLSSVSPPAWSSPSTRAAPFFLSGYQLTDDWLATLGAARTAISAAENCGSTAVALAIFLGCSPIYLIGIDHAVDDADPSRIHQEDADPSAYRAFGFGTGKYPRVPGNYSETVPCFAFSEWQALNRRLTALTSSVLINVTDRGARLEGTKLMHPERLLIARPSMDKRSLLADLPDPSLPVGDVESITARVRAVGRRCMEQVPALRHSLGQGGPAALAQAFRPLLLDPECSRALGAFSLKLMPHLIPPIEGDATSWQGLVEEFAVLAACAETAST